jgi:hypothetical protein
MCIIIHRPKGAATRLSRETLARCADGNPHGFGIMWAYQGKLLTARYMPSQRKEFIKRALLLQESDTPMVLHFRWATHGAVEKANTHPFVIEKGKSAMMHNGILSIPCVKGWSDTRTFCNEVLQRLPAGWERDPAIYWMVDQATLGSKIAIMYADGSVTILHKNAGITEGGIWYSNDGFRPKWESEDWTAAAARWAAKNKGQNWSDGQRSSTTTTAAQAAKVLPFRSDVSKLPIQSSALYRFEGITICGWCLAREANTDDAALVNEPGDGEQCELCYHSPHIPGSRDQNAVKWMKHNVEVEVDDEVEDEGRVATGA